MQRQFGDPNFLFVEFTFPMDANTSKYLYNYFMGIKQTLVRHLGNPKRDLLKQLLKLLKSISRIDERSVILPMPVTYLKVSLFTSTS